MAKDAGRGKATGTKATAKPSTRMPSRKPPASARVAPRPRRRRDTDPFDTPEKAYAEAERLIAEAKAQGSNATELRLQLRRLERLPSSIAGLASLQHIWLDNTQVDDIAPLAGLTALQSLSLDHTPIIDLTPLVGMTALLALWLGHTRVDNLTPLAHLTALHWLTISHTPVSDLASLSGLADLGYLGFDHTPVTSVAPLGRLPALRTLSLDNTLVADLTPLAGLTSLCEGALIAPASLRPGLNARGSRAAETAPFNHLLNLPQPAATVETINYLRRQQGLPEHIPAGYVTPDDPFLASLREGKVRPARGESSKEKKPKRERKKQPPKPPEVPPPRPAAVEPVERNGIITLPPEALTGDLPSEDLAAALLALKNQIKRVADSARNESNPDRRVIAILDELAERIPTGPPPQHELFELAHEVDTLRVVGQIVNEQWPQALAARYHGMVLSFDRTTRQFPRWREFLRNTTRDTFTREELAAAPEAIKAATAELRTDEAAEFIDPRIPAIIDHLVEWPHVDLPEPEQRPADTDGQALDPLAAGKEALIADSLESLSNTLKSIAGVTLQVWDKLEPERTAISSGLAKARKSFDKKLEDGLASLGEAAYKLLVRIAKTAKWGGIASAGYGVLISKFPNIFAWLEPVLLYFRG
jgi:hypothetical protein